MNLQIAIRKAKFTQASLARELKMSPQRVNNWIKRGFVPAPIAADVERLLGVDRRKLCPNFPWPKP